MEIGKLLARLKGCPASSFQLLKLSNPIAKSFNNSLTSESDINGHRRLILLHR